MFPYIIKITNNINNKKNKNINNKIIKNIPQIP